LLPEISDLRQREGQARVNMDTSPNVRGQSGVGDVIAEVFVDEDYYHHQ